MQMKYSVGMYGGSFNPLHIGHLHDIIRAAAMCEELYIIISWSVSRQEAPVKLRYRWILNNVKHLPNVKILTIQDSAESKQEYNTGEYWQKDAQKIKDIIGRPINAVFCGSDYEGQYRFEKLYSPESEIVYFDRNEVPVSSSQLRADVFGNWQYIPPVCRPYYAKRVLIVGSESTGKSTLAENLAIAYNTCFVREIGRETCEIAGGEEFMNADDLYENIIRQKAEEIAALEKCNKILFVDTDALTTKFYADFLLGENIENEKCKSLADAVSDINNFDLVLFLEPDVEFVQDGTRNERLRVRDSRELYSQQLQNLYSERGITFKSVSGNYLERFNQAKKLIEQEFAITTAW